MFLMWVLTVCGLRNRSLEMSSMECPRAICSSTSHSRSESDPERVLVAVEVNGIGKGILASWREANTPLTMGMAGDP
jgi:hypothetical protein